MGRQEKNMLSSTAASGFILVCAAPQEISRWLIPRSLVYDIKVIQGPTGLFLSFPTKKLRDGTYWDIAYPADAETRRIIEQAILAEYEKIVAESENQKATAKYYAMER